MEHKIPLFTNDTIVFGLLMLALGFIFYTSSLKKGFWHKFYKIVPALFMAYMVPALLTTLGLIAPEWETTNAAGEIETHKTNLYFVSSRYLLPAALVLMTLSIDLKAVFNLGPKALIMFFTGTVGIIIGGPIAVLLVSMVSPETVGGVGPDAVWRGLSTLAGSWIGGGANQTAMLEVYGYNQKLYGGMVFVDIVVANIWMALLLIGIGRSKKIDKWLGSDTSAIEALKDKVSSFSKKVSRNPSLSDLMILAAIAFGTVSLAHFLGGYLSNYFADTLAGFESERAKNIFSFIQSKFFWMISISTVIAILLSFTKARNYEGAGAIQSHSSVENDYLSEGFWAENKSAELANPGMAVTFVVSMENVTDIIFKGVEELEGAALSKAMQKNKEAVKKSLNLLEGQKATVKSFNHGNQFYLIVSEDYKDIRFVGAPPSSIGKFGADTDNWMWPRHSGDFSLFRIYADANNRPAEYNENNVPFKPKHFLPVSLDGVEEGDFTLVFGFPGRTDEYLPAIAIDKIVNKLNPDKIALREASLAIMDKYMRQDEQVKIQYASKFAGIANYWKKWIGESQGLTQTKAVEKKRALENEFQKIVQEKGLTEYKNLLADFDKLVLEDIETAQARDYWVEVIYRNVELMNLTFQLYQLEQTGKNKGEEAFSKQRDGVVQKMEGFYKNFDKNIGKEVFAKLMYMYDAKYATTRITEEERAKQWQLKADEVFSTSKLVSYEGLKSLLTGSSEEVIAKLNNDVAYKLGSGYSEKFFKEINPNFYAVKDKLDVIQQKYSKALQEVFPNKRFFPDANSTLRITYGQVKGYEPKDGMQYLPVSYLDGIIEKYVPGDYEFDVSPKLRALYKAKDFGDYTMNGKLPVNFIGTNHTTGGNSGSPVLDADGNLIGLNFDRVWEGTMSDYYYDASICRNIMVDARYILFIIDKYAGATHLIDEMKLVHPKK